MLRKLLYMRSVIKKDDAEILIKGSYGVWFPNLEQEQASDVLGIVDEEIGNSFDRGLRLERDDVMEEKLAVLVGLNQLGNFSTIFNRFSWEEASTSFGKTVMAKLRHNKAKYAARLKAQETKNTDLYEAHLEAIIDAIMRALYNHDRRIHFRKKSG